MDPREMIAQVEAHPKLPGGVDERFRGYGVMALPFRSGHILGLRRFPASSIGPAYASVWHRDPEDRWTFYSDVSPELSCNRYFGARVDTVRECPIEIDWTGSHSFRVRVNGGEVDWQVRLQSTPVSRMMSAACSNLPRALWRREPVLAMMGAAGGRLLHAGKISLHGRTCNGQRFEANPLRIWTIPRSSVELHGMRFDDVGPTPEQARLGDFWLPQRGLFIIGEVFMEQFDAGRHLNQLSRAGQAGTPSRPVAGHTHG
jgi:hypothetical protein